MHDDWWIYTLLVILFGIAGYIGYKIGLYVPEALAVNPTAKLPYIWGKLKYQ